MSLEKEITISKLQIVWTIWTATILLLTIIRISPLGVLYDVFLIVLFFAVWWLGTISIRQSIEDDEE